MNKYTEIKGYPGYFINRHGSVMNAHGHIMHAKKTNNSTTGYYATKLFVNGKPKYPLIHRLLALTFLGDPPTGKHVVNHIDGNGLNNSLSNLEWVTVRENVRHAVRIGLSKGIRGSANKSSKLTEEQTLQVIEMYRQGIRLKEISAIYKIAESTVSRIATGIRRIRDNNVCNSRYTTTKQRQEVK